ncbi:hypothetical protein ACFL2Q_00555 [Thermodesulfobacteriota bacterium]
MSANTNGQFREDELVTRRMKVNGEWQERTFPVVGGRLRLAHEGNERLSIQTEIARLEPDMVVAKATVETEKGRYTGTGTASAQRDARLADSLVELAETRAIARALRFGGVGVEYCGAEEVNHVVDDATPEQTTDNQTGKIFPDSGSDGKAKSKPQSCGIGRATQAQIRALHALTKKADYSKEDVDRMMAPFEVFTFQDLTREAASQLISHLQTEIAA